MGVAARGGIVVRSIDVGVRARPRSGERICWCRLDRTAVHREGPEDDRQRRVIARVLSDAADHPDVEQVHKRASAVDPKISIATVYRTVRLFEEANIMEKHDFRRRPVALRGDSQIAPRPPDRHQIGQGGRVPQRADRGAAARRRRAARLSHRRSPASVHAVPIKRAEGKAN